MKEKIREILSTKAGEAFKIAIIVAIADQTVEFLFDCLRHWLASL